MSTGTATGETLADLLERLGQIPLARIQLHPPPGTATEQDLLVPRTNRDRLCELVDGVLVEKAMGYYESRLAAVLIWLLETFVQAHRLGIVLGADATARLRPGLVRLPDVSFVSRRRLPNQRVPREPVPDLVPDLAVEVISAGNTPQEMERKLQEYFAAGVHMVWYVYPDSKTVRVYKAPDQYTVLHAHQRLEGDEVLPGFAIVIQDWFAQAE
jgi:Uma2 family endonuclease